MGASTAHYSCHGPLLAPWRGALPSKIFSIVNPLQCQTNFFKRFTKSYAPGAVICREGEEGDEMYIIQKGKVRVSKRFADKVRVSSRSWKRATSSGRPPSSTGRGARPR